MSKKSKNDTLNKAPDVLDAIFDGADTDAALGYINRVKTLLTEVIETEYSFNNSGLISDDASAEGLSESYKNALFEICESRRNSARLKQLFALSLEYINDITDEQYKNMIT